jgi:hypothetical protein
MKAMNKQGNNQYKKRLRKDTLPTRSDILFIMKNFNRMNLRDLRITLNITEGKLLEWCKYIFSTDNKEAKWNQMNRQLDELEFFEEFTDSMQSEYDVHDIRRVSGKRMYIVKKKIVNQARMCYLVTLNHNQSIIVRFDIPVERTSVSYCPISIGCDYDVHSLGQWEYIQLEKSLPVINIEADEDYIGKFWLAISNTLNA